MKKRQCLRVQCGHLVNNDKAGIGTVQPSAQLLDQHGGESGFGGHTGVMDGEETACDAAINVNCSHAIAGGADDCAKLKKPGHVLDGFCNAALSSARITSEDQARRRVTGVEDAEVKTAMFCLEGMQSRKIDGKSLNNTGLGEMKITGGKTCGNDSVGTFAGHRPLSLHARHT